MPTAAHKLARRTTPCVFFGYSSDHRGYRCYDPKTRRVFTSRHVIFDEHQFPFRDASSVVPPSKFYTSTAKCYREHPPVRVSPSTSSTPLSRNSDSASPLVASSPSPEAPRQHPMITRGRAGIVKPNPRYLLPSCQTGNNSYRLDLGSLSAVAGPAA